MAERQSWSGRNTRDNKETEARNFNSKVLNCKIQASVRGIREQGQSWVLFPWDTDTKSGRLVMEVLREKHPAICIPYLIDPECSSFEEYEKEPDVVPLCISE